MPSLNILLVAFRPVQNITTYNAVFSYSLFQYSPPSYSWSSRLLLSIIFLYQNYKFISQFYYRFFFSPSYVLFVYVFLLLLLFVCTMHIYTHLFGNFLQQMSSNDLVLLHIHVTVCSTIFRRKLLVVICFQFCFLDRAFS